MHLPRCSRAERVGKAWGTGIGVGPVWQIVEDLGWFREAEKLKPGAVSEQQVSGEAAVVEPTSEQEQEPVYDERRRRPRVYADVAPPEGWADPLHIECLHLLFLTNGPCVGFLMPFCQRWDHIHAN